MINEFLSNNQDTITLIVGAAGGYIISWLKSKQDMRKMKDDKKLNKEKAKEDLVRAKTVSMSGAEAAEQKYKKQDNCGSEKTSYAIKYTQELLKLEGIEMTDIILDGMIHECLYSLDETTDINNHETPTVKENAAYI